MIKLLKKEVMLAMHPTSAMFLALSAMLLIPSYPYYVVFFYTSLSIFFTCLNGRENHDIFYSMLLPVAKRDVVKARMIFAVLLQGAQLLIAIPFAWLRQGFALPGNQGGMDANIALFGLSLVMLGIFNAFFFRAYYKDVRRVGVAFVRATVALFLFIVAAEACTFAVPFFRDRLDTPDPQFLGEKLAVLAIGLVVYAVLTYSTYRQSVRRFEMQDI